MLARITQEICKHRLLAFPLAFFLRLELLDAGIVDLRTETWNDIFSDDQMAPGTSKTEGADV